MNKQTQMIIGLVAVAGIGYWLWKSGQKPQGFANAVGRGTRGGTTGRIATPKGSYTAGGYEPKEQGGSQWMASAGDGSLGYWYPCNSMQHPRPCFPVGTVVYGWYL